MNVRQQQILEIIRKSGKWIKGDELAELLNVTTRTIRSDINRINEEELYILSNSHYGYCMNKRNESQIKVVENTSIPETPIQRARYLLKELLVSRHPINLVMMQDVIFASLTTLEKDVRRIRGMIEAYPELELVKKKNSISLEGNEFEKRRLYKDMLGQEVSGNFLNMNKLAEFYKSFDLIKVSELLEGSLKTYNYSIRKMSFSILMVHVGVAIERILQMKYIDSECKPEIESTVECEIAKDFYKKVAKMLDVEIVEEEIQMLARLLYIRKNGSQHNTETTVNGVVLSTNEIVGKVLDEILLRFDVDFKGDNELEVGLAMHIQSFSSRVENKSKVKNVFLEDIKRHYALIFEMGVSAARAIEGIWGVSVNEEEIGFLAIHLGAAYDRITKDRKIKAVLIYPHEASFSHICESKIESKFSSQLEIINTYNLFNEKEINQIQPDLIITTTQLNHNLSISTVQISLFVTSEDESKIFQVINEINKKTTYFESVSRIEEILVPDLFYSKLKVKSPKEAIKIISHDAALLGLAPVDFFKYVWKREEISSTSFAYGFATPHAMNNSAFQSFLAIAFLEKPILWGEHMVELIFFLGVKEDDYEIMKFFFDWLVKIMNNDEELKVLLTLNEYELFMDAIIHLEGN